MAIFNRFDQFGTGLSKDFQKFSQQPPASAQAPTLQQAKQPIQQPTALPEQPRGGTVDTANLSATAIDSIASLAAGAVGAVSASKSQKESEKTKTELARFDEEEFGQKLGALTRKKNIQGQDFQTAIRDRAGAGANRVRQSPNISQMPLNPNIGTQRFGGAR